MLTTSEIAYLSNQAKKIRKTVLSIITCAHASHIASAYSVVDLLVYLYAHTFWIPPHNSSDSNRDRFILSKGWGVSALYAVLATHEFFPLHKLESYCKDGSKFIGIATRNGIPGVEATTGSMGHGLPIGVGMALAMKMQTRKSRVFVLIGDGECDEGSTWEAVLQAGHHKLDNLVVIIDVNTWQSFGRTKDILNLEPLSDKWKAFNWSTVEIDGHSFKEMDKVFSKIPFVKNKPSVIIAHTIKGKGVSVFEDKNEWHYKTPTDREIAIANKELSIV